MTLSQLPGTKTLVVSAFMLSGFWAASSRVTLGAGIG